MTASFGFRLQGRGLVPLHKDEASVCERRRRCSARSFGQTRGGEDLHVAQAQPAAVDVPSGVTIQHGDIVALTQSLVAVSGAIAPIITAVDRLPRNRPTYSSSLATYR
jgi:hypothetical protein